MSLKHLTLLQIGDIHFPEARMETFSHSKDKGFPSAIAGMTAMRPLVYVSRALVKELEKKPHALLFSGDLTSKGSVTGYSECLAHLKGLINFKRWEVDSIHVVPGNHDVDRAHIDPKGEDLFQKFRAFTNLWEDLGLPILSVDRFRETQIALSKKSSVRVFSVNSSLGCGEKRFLPSEISDEFEKILKEYESKVGPDKAFGLLGETLDTPAFAQDNIDAICQTIETLSKDTIPIILSHHNILPQALPRIAMYTETINAGIVRSRLSHLQRPVLYCHGHIHDHPLEIVYEPEYEGSKVICISAPKFTAGFNSIRIDFGAQGQPLGCVVVSHRQSRRDYQIRQHEIRIPFHGPNPDTLRKLAQHKLARVLARWSDQDVRFPDVLKSVSTDETIDLNKTNLANALLEAEWLGFLAILDRDEQPEQWAIRKIVR
jgi:hypothetical protein